MGWQTIVALVIMTPVILLPAVLVWYINLGGMVLAVREARARRAARQVTAEQTVTTK